MKHKVFEAEPITYIDGRVKWIVSDDRWDINDITCANKEHAVRVAAALNAMVKHGLSQQHAELIARELRTRKVGA
jgi:hypothetical protein